MLVDYLWYFSNHFPQSLEEGYPEECCKIGKDYIMIKKEESYSSLTQINSPSTTLHLRYVDGITANDCLYYVIKIVLI